MTNAVGPAYTVLPPGTTPSGDYVVNGAVFGNQIALRDLPRLAAKAQDVRGTVDVKEFDLGAIANPCLASRSRRSRPPADSPASLAVKLTCTSRLREERRPAVDVQADALARRTDGEPARTSRSRGRTTQRCARAGRSRRSRLREQARRAGAVLRGPRVVGALGVLVAQGKIDRALSAPCSS